MFVPDSEGSQKYMGACQMPIARLTPVPLREVWRHEAHDFTRWLADNLDFLAEATGLSLSLVEQEAAAGAFYVDILAEDGAGSLVIIENQLGQTDHDHLGKLLTYMSNHDAKTAIWITSQPRPEHERAVQWLNETLPADTSFFLLQLEAFRIGDSPPAPKLTLVAGPSPESRAIGSQKKELAERHKLRLDFWRSLQERLAGKTSLHANITPGKENWISTGAGRSGLAYNYVILMDACRVELYIDTGDGEVNKRYFDKLYAQKEAIEGAFGALLDWQRMDDRRASRICYLITDKGGLKTPETWPELQDAMIDAMIRLHKALDPRVKNL